MPNQENQADQKGANPIRKAAAEQASVNPGRCAA